MITYFCDSDCDISKKEAEHLGFELISMPYVIDGKEIFPYIGDYEFNPHEFYDYLRNCKTIPSTCSLSSEEYKKYFEPELKKGNDIFYAHFSGKMSSTFSAMNIAADELKETYPNAKFYFLDLCAITTLAYAELVEISKLIKEGNSPEDIIRIFNERILNNYALLAFSDDLKFFKKSGRLNGISATLGQMINAKPILSIDNHGIMSAIDKQIGKKNAIKWIISNMKKIGDDVAGHTIYVTHSDCMNIVDEVIKSLKKEFGENLNIKVLDINPTIGIHCGPDSLGIVFHSIRRTL